MAWTTVTFPAAITGVVYDNKNEDEAFVTACENVKATLAAVLTARAKDNASVTIAVAYRQGKTRVEHDSDPRD